MGDVALTALGDAADPDPNAAQNLDPRDAAKYPSMHSTSP